MFTVQTLRLSPFKPMGKRVPTRLTVAEKSDSKLSEGGLMEAFSWTDAFGSSGDTWSRLDLVMPKQPLRNLLKEEQMQVWERFQSTLDGINLRLIFNGNNSTTHGVRIKRFAARRPGPLFTVHFWTEEHFKKYDSAADGDVTHRNPWRDILQRNFPPSAFQEWQDNSSRSLVERFQAGEVTPRVGLATFYPREVYLLNLDTQPGRLMTEVHAFEVPTRD